MRSDWIKARHRLQSLVGKDWFITLLHTSLCFDQMHLFVYHLKLVGTCIPLGTWSGQGCVYVFFGIVMRQLVYIKGVFQEPCVDINANLINKIDLYPHCYGTMENSLKLLQVDNRQKHGAVWHVVNLYLSGTSHLFRPTHEQSLTNPFFFQWAVSNTSTADSSDSLWGSVGFPQMCLVQTENPTETNQKSVYDPLNTFDLHLFSAQLTLNFWTLFTSNFHSFPFHCGRDFDQTGCWWMGCRISLTRYTRWGLKEWREPFVRERKIKRHRRSTLKSQKPTRVSLTA